MALILRIAAAAVAAVTAVAILFPSLWLPPPKAHAQDQLILFEHYFIDGPTIVAMLLAGAVVALLLVAIARILDRLDALQQRSNHDD